MKWKRVAAAVAAVLASGAMLAGCGSGILGGEYDYAYIWMPDGSCVQGKVDNWGSYGEEICVTIDGVEYRTAPNRVVLVRRAE